MDNRPIGIYDSGFGGLSVLKELRDKLPKEDYLYFGDTKRIPYGSKDKETIQLFSKQVTSFLMEKNVKMIVLACNTVTANAMEYLQENFNIPIIGIIDSGVKSAISSSKNNVIAVLGTEATINSEVYYEKLKKENKELEILSVACPEFVPLVEEGSNKEKEIEEAAKKYYKEISNREFDTVILACTHYPHIVTEIKKVFGENKTYINPAIKLVDNIKKFLEYNNLENGKNSLGNIDFYTSGELDSFRENGSIYFGEKIEDVKSKIF
ncbi:glutamate racemase [Miniphocaeibacter halophilus]|uniref:Glutamate racemase n=1 Tax=Miniphocaeibacter halophilus TaxID=2931922 RepID=A0AC61MWJ9_9FIRM|nr:glutamate racemase [Miniphocaeibacter halophilus]QQK07976.1 glutamate racemase [Miniphocaeibacter halophilus]